MWLADWQTIVALLCVAGAAAALGKRLRDRLTGSAATGCHSCPARHDKSSSPLTNLTLSPSLKARQGNEAE